MGKIYDNIQFIIEIYTIIPAYLSIILQFKHFKNFIVKQIIHIGLRISVMSSAQLVYRV